MTGVSIDRSSLGKGPLLIGDTGAAPYCLTDTGLGRPAVTARTTSAGSSPWLHGDVPVAVVREQTALPLEVYVHAATEAALGVLVGDLDEALWQFSYEVTVTEGTDATTWLASPASYGVADGVTMHYNVADHFEVWTITIPLYPIPVT